MGYYNLNFKISEHTNKMELIFKVNEIRSKLGNLVIEESNLDYIDDEGKSEREKLASRNIIRTVIQKIAKLKDLDYITWKKISGSSNLKKDIDLSSLDIAELVMNLEDEYVTDITETDVSSWKTVSDIVDTIKYRKMA